MRKLKAISRRFANLDRMQLLIIRHGIAEERDVFATTGRPDDERPLTPQGERRMQRNARGLRRTAPRISTLVASPLVRAQQTADIVREVYGLADVECLDSLSPDQHPRSLLTWLGRQPKDATVAVVGHDPHLGKLATWCLAGVAEQMVMLKKGGAALVEFEGKPAAKKGRLLWLLTPAQLRRLAS
jgi:phosphohistidine phosphatase